MLGPGRVGVYSHSFGHTTDILRTKDRALQTEEPDTTDKEPDILRTKDRTLQTEEPDTTDKEPDILRTSYGHPTDKEPDILRTSYGQGTGHHRTRRNHPPLVGTH